jgi:Protein of unknown function (DUF1566)
MNRKETMVQGKRSRGLRQVFACAGVTGALLVGGVSVARAAFTTPVCLAKKLKEWGKLRNCQVTENGKALQAKSADPAKCQMTFDANLAKLNGKATAAAIACRYVVNGDGTATDYDTGLQWEQKTDDGSVHDKDNTYSWTTVVGDTTPNGTAFTAFVGTLNNGTSSDGTATSGCFAGHCDWRLPAIEELAGIVDLTQGNCSGGSGPCIDQAVFGPTVAFNYWSATTDATALFDAWDVFFSDGAVSLGVKSFGIFYVRGVRSGL